MLTIYEQIQQSVDCIENRLFEGVSTETAAHAACMSVRSFHRYFPAVTGYRISPTGAMNGTVGSNVPSFNIQFRVRIQ